MASKVFPLFSITLIFLLILQKSSAFDFLKQLQGHNKSDQKVKGVQELKKYLTHFGYLRTYQNQYDDEFDDELESAIKTYQLNFHLNVTGFLDSETVSQMMLPRCGVEDITDGKTRMESGKINRKTPISLDYFRQNSSAISRLHTVSHYAFFPGKPKWPSTKYNLTFGFVAGALPESLNAVRSAFVTWQGQSQFTFAETDVLNSDLKIGFYKRDHGDGKPFDGPKGFLAHAFAPEDGRFHYDADEQWSEGAQAGAFDLETVAFHEIGHLLGLAHTSVKEAIMYPIIPEGKTKALILDDINGLKDLYDL